MDCEICGKDSDSLTLVSVQGSQLRVCRGCKSHGVEVPQKFQSLPKKMAFSTGDSEEDFMFVDNYGKLIQQARQKMNLDSRQFAEKIAEQESFVKKIEAEKMKPTEKVTKKIERLLNIKIYKRVEEE